MNNDIEFLTKDKEHDIPSQILKTILDCMHQSFFRHQYMWFLSYLYVGMIPNSSDQLAELIFYIIPLE